MANPKAPPGGFKEGGWYEGRQYIGGTFGAPGVIHPQSPQVGAGQPVSKEVIAQTDPANVAYIEEEKKIYQQQPSQAPTSADQVTPFLNQFQGEMYDAGQEPAVRIPTMEELKETLKPDVGLPPLLKRAEEREALRLEYGVAELETSLTDIKDQIENEMNILREQRGIEEGKPVPLGVIAGRITEEERVAQQRIDFLGRQQNRIVDELNTKYTIIGQYMQDIGLDYGDAIDRYDNEFQQNITMYNIISQKEEAALTQLERNRTAARANLQIYTNAITAGNLDYASMSEDQKLMIGKLEAQSGFPIGFIGSLNMSAQDRLLSVNDKTGEALMMNADGTFNVVQTGMRIAPEEVPAPERRTIEKTETFNELQSELDRLGGGDKYVRPDQWQYLRRQWISLGYPGDEFDDAFRGTYVNPDWSASDFGLEEL